MLTPNLDGKIGEIFLECLATAQERYGVRVYGYILMSNHYHMLVHAPHLNLSPFMRDLQSPFTKRVNRLRDRRGSLFPERFSCEEITDGLSLFIVLRYILLNPVRAGLVSHPSEWPGLISFPKNGKNPKLLSRCPTQTSFRAQWKGQETSIHKALSEDPRCHGPFIGVEKVLQTEPSMRIPKPRTHRRSLRDKIFAASQEKKDKLTEERRQLEREYDETYELFILSMLACLHNTKDPHQPKESKYPAGMAPPPIIYPPGAFERLLAKSDVDLMELEAFRL